jgi:hypothetical protein
MRDRQRLAAARRVARERAKLVSSGIMSAPTKRKPQSIPATAEQLAFRDYCAMGYTAEEARAMISEELSQSRVS